MDLNAFKKINYCSPTISNGSIIFYNDRTNTPEFTFKLTSQKEILENPITDEEFAEYFKTAMETEESGLAEFLKTRTGVNLALLFSCPRVSSLRWFYKE